MAAGTCSGCSYMKAHGCNRGNKSPGTMWSEFQQLMGGASLGHTRQRSAASQSAAAMVWRVAMRSGKAGQALQMSLHTRRILSGLIGMASLANGYMILQTSIVQHASSICTSLGRTAVPAGMQRLSLQTGNMMIGEMLLGQVTPGKYSIMQRHAIPALRHLGLRHGW